MKLYADHGPRLHRQIGGDLAALVLLILGAWLAVFVRDQILGFRDAADRIEAAGERVSGGADAAAGTLADVPLVGSALASPFGAVAEAGRDLGAAGSEAGASIHNLALVLPLVILVLLVGWLLAGYLPRRLAWMREAAVIAELAAGPDTDLLLAQRAIARRELRDFQRAGIDPAAALAARDWAGLAGVEYHAMGLRREAR